MVKRKEESESPCLKLLVGLTHLLALPFTKTTKLAKDKDLHLELNHSL